ncbi:hypothetical protein [Flavobacterium sp. WC2509]|uniref:hypothetical protein n=1 Tax=Flavobacterium sp. WC2509 TaxID=3461406 RepID=UPI0040445376
MKTAHKIVLYSLCLLITLSWGINCAANIIKTTNEKNIQDRKETLPGGESDEEDKIFELVYEFLPSYNIPFLATTTTELNFSKVATLPQSVFLDLSNPPPEFYLFA